MNRYRHILQYVGTCIYVQTHMYMYVHVDAVHVEAKRIIVLVPE